MMYFPLSCLLPSLIPNLFSSSLSPVALFPSPFLLFFPANCICTYQHQCCFVNCSIPVYCPHCRWAGWVSGHELAWGDNSVVLTMLFRFSVPRFPLMKCQQYDLSDEWTHRVSSPYCQHYCHHLKVSLGEAQEGGGRTYTYGCFMLRYGRNQHSSVK